MSLPLVSIVTDEASLRSAEPPRYPENAGLRPEMAPQMTEIRACPRRGPYFGPIGDAPEPALTHGAAAYP